MKILIISVFFPQENMVAALRPYSWAKYWSLMGHDVTVLTPLKGKSATDLNLDVSMFKLYEIPLPGFLEKFIFPAKNESIANRICHSGGYPESTINNKPNRVCVIKSTITRAFYQPFKYILNKLRKYGAFSGLRMPDKFDLWYFPAYNFAKKKHWELVVSSYGPYVSHLVAYRLKKMGQCSKWIADYRDLWTSNHSFNYGLFPFNFIEEYLEKKINYTADIITTVSAPLAEQLKNKYKLNSIHVVENGFDFDDLISLDKNSYWSKKKVRLVYTGCIYEGKQDPEPIFKAIAKISQSNACSLLEWFQLLLLGKIQPNIVALVKKYNIEKYVIFQDFMARSDTLRIQRDADALLFFEFNGFEGILSGKLFEYFASGTQIFSIGGTNPNSYVSNFIKESGCGKVLGVDVELIEKELLLLLKAKNKVITDTSFAHQYSRKALAEKMLQLIV